MKKKVSFALGLLSVAGFIMSCAEEQSPFSSEGTHSTSEDYTTSEDCSVSSDNSMETSSVSSDDLVWKNFRLENVGDYNTIGFASFSKTENGTKSGRRDLNVNENEDFVRAQAAEGLALSDFIKTSPDAPFSLVGVMNDEIEKLNFTNGDETQNFYIDYFEDIGDFIYFHPFPNAEGALENGNYRSEYGSKYGLWFNRPQWEFENSPEFMHDDNGYLFLSKKTGKIYEYPKNFEMNSSNICRFKNGGGITYAANQFTHDLFGGEAYDGYLYKLIEEDETLKFVQTQIPAEYIIDFIDNSGSSPNVDKYGNFLTKNGIIDRNLKNHKFNSYFDGGGYYFNVQEKEICYFSSDHLKSYILNADGNFIEDENALKGLVFHSCWKWDENSEITKEEYLNEIINDCAVPGDNYFDCSYFTYNKDNYIMYSRGDYQESFLYQNDKYAYCTYAGYFVDERGFYVYMGLEEESFDFNIWSFGASPIFRKNAVYYYKNDELRKFDMTNATDERISFEYTLMSLGVDEYGRITVECLDDSFNQFVGYLEMDDTISLEAKEVPKIIDYVLYPVN